MRSESMKGISMDVGDYGWIECKGENEKYSGWFLRAKVDGKVTYINKSDPSFMFPDTKITSQSDEFTLCYKVSAIDALKGNFPQLTREDMERLNLAYPIRRKVDILIKEIKQLKNAYNDKVVEKDELLKKLYDIENGIIPTYKLVHGVHDLSKNAFTYTWINDKGLDIKIGDVVEVDTSCGIKRIVVTGLEDSKVKNNHKSVIRKVDKLP